MRRRDFLRAAGGTTAVASTAVGTAASQETASPTPDGTPSGTPTPGDGGTTHTVDMTDALVFEPEEITIAPGDTVEWVNVGSVGHTVTAYEDEIPDGAAYFASGGFESEQAARDAYPEGDIPGGESYAHTFETAGEFGYFCIPHEAAGMVGTVVVQEGGGEAEAAGPIEVDPEHMGVPFQAHWVGIATVLGIVVSLVFTFFLLKYGETPHTGYPERK